VGLLRAGIVCVLAAGCGRFSFDPGADDGDDAPPGSARITVTVTGGDGLVVGPAGLSCSTGTCSVDVPIGAPATLRGLAETGSWLAGWSGACGGNFDCDFVADGNVAVVATFSPRPNRVFVTSQTVDGAFGGADAADLLCATSAQSAGLDGTWVAYVSDSTIEAGARIAGSRGWIRVDGAPVGDSPGSLTDGPIVFPARLDEYGDDVGVAAIYTGTIAGAIADDCCLDWSSNLATDLGSVVYAHWGSTLAFDGWGESCEAQAHLLCVEIGRIVPVAIAPASGRLAFVTAAMWTPGGGRDGADALCASEAAAAGVPGTFLAALATSTETIASRFAPGAPWRRVDGVRLTRGPTMFGADYLDVAPELDLQGRVVVNDYWTGARRFDALPDPGGNCGDWTIGDTSSDGDMHFTTSTWVGTPAKREPCDSAVALLCLEQ
jgi:hypothetical protein